MKLCRVEIKNYRSLFTGAASDSFVLDLADGMNTIVGPNNCGKSNVFRALAVALDPDFTVDRAKDMPSTGYSKPVVTLTFEVEQGCPSPEETLLRYLEDYERALRPDAHSTNASRRKIVLRVSIEGTGDSVGSRRTVFVVPGVGARSLRDEDPIALKALRQFQKCFQFVIIRSGQSLESLLEGKFRDILRVALEDDSVALLEEANAGREAYAETIREKLLQSLTERIGCELAEVFPEVDGVTLRPHIPGLEESLTRMRVDISDAATTDLADKGTGVRGGLIVAILRHLAETGRRSILFAVEEPEAFLHPAAQETLREDLEALATRDNVTLLVASHSPYVVSREPDARVFALEKEPTGRTVICGQANGTDRHAPVLGGLFRGRMVADLLDRATDVPDSARAVLVVEGWTDEQYFRLAAERAGRLDLLDGVHFVQAGAGVETAHSGGAALAVMQAVLVQPSTDAQVAIVLDNDDEGLGALHSLAKIGEKTKVWKRDRNLLTYRLGIPGSNSSAAFPYESEDLWPGHLYESLLEVMGEDAVLTGKVARPNPHGGWHYDLHINAKGAFVEHLEARVKADDCGLWIAFLELIRSKLKLETEAAA